MNVYGDAGNYRLVDVDGATMTLREGAQRREVRVAEGSWFINCTTHFRPIPHEPILQDDGAVCAPQLAMGFSGTSAYYVTHLWYRDELARLAPQFFRARVDVEPKLRYGVHVALMVMANMALAGARLPPSLFAKFRGDLGKWYPLYRQLPVTLGVVRKRAEILRKAEELLKSRYSDAEEVAPLPSRRATSHDETVAGTFL